MAGASGAGAWPAGTLVKGSRDRQPVRCRSTGHTTAMARPTTRSSDTKAFSPVRVRPRVVEMAARVAAVLAVVAQHEDASAGTTTSKGMVDGRSCTPSDDGVQIAGLVQRLVVDGDPALRVAADDMVAGQPDRALDQVLGAGVGRTPTNSSALPTGPRSAGPAAPVSQPPGSLNTTTSPRLSRAELLHHDPVVDLQRVLHRHRRDDEHLADEAAQQRRDDRRRR